MSGQFKGITSAPFSFFPIAETYQPAPQPAPLQIPLLPIPLTHITPCTWKNSAQDWAPCNYSTGSPSTPPAPAIKKDPVVRPTKPASNLALKTLNLAALSLPKTSNYPVLPATVPPAQPASERPNYPVLPDTSPVDCYSPVDYDLPIYLTRSGSDWVVMTHQPSSAVSAPQEKEEEPKGAPAASLTAVPTTPALTANFAKRMLSKVRSQLPVQALAMVPVLPQDFLKQLKGLDVGSSEYNSAVKQAVSYFMTTYGSWSFKDKLKTAQRIIDQFNMQFTTLPENVEQCLSYHMGLALLSEPCTFEQINEIYWLTNIETGGQLPDAFLELIAQKIVNTWNLPEKWKEALSFCQSMMPTYQLLRTDLSIIDLDKVLDLSSFLIPAALKKIFTPVLLERIAQSASKDMLTKTIVLMFRALEKFIPKATAEPDCLHMQACCAPLRAMFAEDRETFFAVKDRLSLLTRTEPDLTELFLELIS